MIMRRRPTLGKFLAIPCFLGISIPALSGADTLVIYPMETQNGTIARRTVTDEHQRPVREIYYRTNASPKSPTVESDLIPYVTRLYNYDRQGREEWMGEYSPKLILQRSFETLYEAEGRRQTRLWRDTDGIVRYQSRSENGSTVSHLYFDDTGKDLISIRGKIPPDMDMASGWGKPAGGLACGIGINRSRGKIHDFRFYVTVRNLTASPLVVVSCLPYQEIKVELRDASRHLVKVDTGHLRRRDKDLRAMNPDKNDTLQTIQPTESQTFNGGHELKDWYPGLPSGTYILTVWRRADGPDFALASNPVQLQVEE